MALSASGIGSGLDVDGIVSQLMAVESRPLTVLAQREAGVQAKISAFGTMTSLVASLQTAAGNLNKPAIFATTKATPGTNAGYTATTSTGAQPGTYSIDVLQLAASQRVAVSAETFAQDDDRIAAGTLTIGFGSADALADGEAETTHTLEFAGGTLRDLRDAINDAKLGVTANIVDDGTTRRLVFSGAATGAAQAFTLQGLGLDFSPSDPGDENDAVYLLQAAGDAVLKVDGLTITRSSNVIEDVIEGVRLELTTAGGGPVTMKVTADHASARSAIEAFVNAYNSAVNGLANLTHFNTETRQGSVLTGDSTARAVQAQLRSVVGATFRGLGGVERLPDLGITFQLDGTLSIDSAKLNAALADPELDVAAFFTGRDGTKGFAGQVADSLGRLIGSEGLITGRTAGLKSTVTDLQSRAQALTLRLENIEKRYRAQFAALDVLIANMTQTSTYLQQQLANLPGAGGR